MNFANFTIKSQEAIQRAQQIAQSYGHQQIENEHIVKAILEVDENVTPFLLKKLNVNLAIIPANTGQHITKLPKSIWWRNEPFARCINSVK